MSRLFYHVMQDNVGNLLFDVSGTMRLAGTGTAATIYGDPGLSVVLPNPMTNHPSFGSFKCYLGPGSYDFYMAKGGYTFETLTGLAGGGSMANQDANAVAITGGTATVNTLHVLDTAVTGDKGFYRPNSAGNNQYALYSDIAAGGGTERYAIQLIGDAPNYVNGNMGLGGIPVANGRLRVVYPKDAANGLILQPTVTDAGGATVAFNNLAGTNVGSINTSATATAYNTSSDVRLKHTITALTGALDRVRALRPVAFRWNADDSQGHGFLAHELQREIPDAVTGEPDAVHEDGSVQPQQVDHSKLVPWLTAALQEAVAQVQALTARVASLEAQRGV